MADTLKLRQASFAGGEISPDLHGRTDLDNFAKSLKTCKNFIVTPYGGVRNRPGTQYLGATKSDNPARIIAFPYDEDTTYFLEFTDTVMRVWLKGELQVVDGAASNDLPTIAGWDETGMWNLDFAQMGDVMFITDFNDGYKQPYVLTRVAADEWKLETYQAAAAHAAAGASAPAFTTAGNLDITGDGTHPLLPWVWLIARVDANGVESKPVGLAPAGPIHMGPDRVGVLANPEGTPITWTGIAGANGYRIYRGVLQGGGSIGLFGLVGETVGDIVTFQDDGREPDYTQVPKTDDLPFLSPISPDCVTLFEQRLIFGQLGTTGERLPVVKGSWLGEVYDWMEQHLKDDKGPFEHGLAGAYRERIRHLVPMRDLIALTASSEFVISGAQRGVLGPLSVRIRPESQNGASWLKPLVINNACLYVQNLGGLIRDLFYDFQRDGYNGTELSIRARHLFLGRTVQDWDYAQNHDSVVWTSVNDEETYDDEQLVGLTYDPASKVFAWHQHEVATKYYPGFQGFESIAAGPEIDRDVVYVCRRHPLYDAGGTKLLHDGDPVTFKYYIERMATREVGQTRFGIFLDSSVSMDGRVNTTDGFEGWIGEQPTFSVVVGLQLNENEGLEVGDNNTWVSDSAVFTAGAYPAVGDVGRYVVLNPDSLGSSQRVVMLITAVNSTQSIDADIISINGVTTAGTTLAGGHWDDDFGDFHAEWAFADTEVTGLSHLEAEDVYALADGVQQGPFTVASGAITLDSPGVVIHAGLAIDAYIETLDANLPSEPGFKSMKKNLAKVYVELDEADGLQAATSVGTFKDLPDGTDMVEGPTVATYDHNGRVQIKQNSALPVTIRAIVREFLPED